MVLWIYVPLGEIFLMFGGSVCRQEYSEDSAQTGKRQTGLTSNKTPNLPNLSAPTVVMLPVHLSHISFFLFLNFCLSGHLQY